MNETTQHDLLQKAINFANEKHKKQTRKGSNFPYIVHIYEVMQILLTNGATIETAIVGVLHDTVEDTNTTLDDIEKEFGLSIMEKVDILSENKSLAYDQRKAFQAFRISTAPTSVKMVKCADCLSNLRAIKNDSRFCNVWQKFNAPKESIQRHYEATIRAISELKDFAMFKELNNLYYDVFIKEKNQKVSSTPILKNNSDCFVLSKQESDCNQKKELRYCTKCPAMLREADPDPHDWFCDDDQKYICGITKQVLSSGNRPYETQLAPHDCPLEK